MKTKIATSLLGAVFLSTTCFAAPVQTPSSLEPFSAEVLQTLTLPSADLYPAYCDAAYQKTLVKRGKNAGWRGLGEFTLDAALGTAAVLGVLAIPGGGTILIWSLFIGGAGIIVPGAGVMVGEGIWRTFDHSDVIEKAYSTMMLTKVSVSDLQKVYHDATVVQKVAAENATRKGLGLPALNADEVAKINATIGYDYWTDNGIDALLGELFLENNSDNYELVRSEIIELSKTDAFCPMRNGKNRPMTYGHMRRLVRRGLRNHRKHLHVGSETENGIQTD